MSAPGQITPPLRNVIERLGQIVESLSVTANSVERAFLLKEFRLLLDIADDVIFREFPVSN